MEIPLSSETGQVLISSEEADVSALDIPKVSTTFCTFLLPVFPLLLLLAFLSFFQLYLVFSFLLTFFCTLGSSF